MKDPDVRGIIDVNSANANPKGPRTPLWSTTQRRFIGVKEYKCSLFWICIQWGGQCEALVNGSLVILPTSLQYLHWLPGPKNKGSGRPLCSV